MYKMNRGLECDPGVIAVKLLDNRQFMKLFKSKSSKYGNTCQNLS